MSKRILSGVLCVIMVFSLLCCQMAYNVSAAGETISFSATSVSNAERGGTYEIDFCASSQIPNISGLEMSVSFTDTSLKLIEMKSDKLEDIFTTQNGGTIQIIWTSPTSQTFNAGDKILTFRFNVLPAASANSTQTVTMRVKTAYSSTVVGGKLVSTEFKMPVANVSGSIVIGANSVVDHVIALINNIGTVEYTEESLAKINAAMDAYSLLSPTEKEMVTNSNVLTLAIAAYQEAYEKANNPSSDNDAKINQFKTKHAAALGLGTDSIPENMYEPIVDAYVEFYKLDPGLRVQMNTEKSKVDSLFNAIREQNPGLADQFLAKFAQEEIDEYKALYPYVFDLTPTTIAQLSAENKYEYVGKDENGDPVNEVITGGAKGNAIVYLEKATEGLKGLSEYAQGFANSTQEKINELTKALAKKQFEDWFAGYGETLTYYSDPANSDKLPYILAMGDWLTSARGDLDPLIINFEQFTDLYSQYNEQLGVLELYYQLNKNVDNSNPAEDKARAYITRFQWILSQTPDTISASDATEIAIAYEVLQFLDEDVLEILAKQVENVNAMYEKSLEFDSTESDDSAGGEVTTITNTVTLTKTVYKQSDPVEKTVVKTVAANTGDFLVKVMTGKMGITAYVLMGILGVSMICLASLLWAYFYLIKKNNRDNNAEPIIFESEVPLV
ncbi:MAG: hypothetical protein Q4B04_00320 [bacterium]|nr:hypothetical protein [bacterium]